MATSTQSQAGTRKSRQAQDRDTDTNDIQEQEDDEQINLSPADILVSIKGLKFPTNKARMIARAQKKNAPEEVISFLNNFEDRVYRTMPAVFREFSRVKRSQEGGDDEDVADLLQ